MYVLHSSEDSEEAKGEKVASKHMLWGADGSRVAQGGAAGRPQTPNTSGEGGHGAAGAAAARRARRAGAGSAKWVQHRDAGVQSVRRYWARGASKQQHHTMGTPSAGRGAMQRVSAVAADGRRMHRMKGACNGTDWGCGMGKAGSARVRNMWREGGQQAAGAGQQAAGAGQQAGARWWLRRVS
ncbi:hypothetical protein K438DRAFT_1755655 [Mycena galopus ATCC 62051]|nr:hypothetical protein K438DRAFT_1755655 [Mycena galopus ATCC 62051]